MNRIIPMGEKELFSADTPDLMLELYEWSKQNHSVMDDQFVQMTPYLTITHTDLGTEKPPSFYMVGKKSAARAVFGDHWADNVRTSQLTPIKNLDQLSATGYFNALQNDFSFDYVEFQTDNVSGTYRRLIIPIRSEIGMEPSFFVMLPTPVHIEHKHHKPDVTDRSSSNIPEQSFH